MLKELLVTLFASSNSPSSVRFATYAPESVLLAQHLPCSRCPRLPAREVGRSFPYRFPPRPRARADRWSPCTVVDHTICRRRVMGGCHGVDPRDPSPDRGLRRPSPEDPRAVRGAGGLKLNNRPTVSMTVENEITAHRNRSASGSRGIPRSQQERSDRYVYNVTVARAPRRSRPRP